MPSKKYQYKPVYENEPHIKLKYALFATINNIEDEQDLKDLLKSAERLHELKELKKLCESKN